MYTNNKKMEKDPVLQLKLKQKKNKGKKIDAIIDEKEQLIRDLDLYKKSMIFEVVTGQRKVV